MNIFSAYYVLNTDVDRRISFGATFVIATYTLTKQKLISEKKDTILFYFIMYSVKFMDL